MTSKRGWVCRVMNRILTVILPRHGKRAVFLTTLFVEISKISPTHKGFLEELNQHLKIVDTNDALDFPAKLHNTIWRGRELQLRVENGEISEEELNGIAARIIHDLPEWSSYGNYHDVLRETHEVIKTSLRVNGKIA